MHHITSICRALTGPSSRAPGRCKQPWGNGTKPCKAPVARKNLSPQNMCDNLGNPPTPLIHALNMKYTSIPEEGEGGVRRLPSHQRETQLLVTWPHTHGATRRLSMLKTSSRYLAKGFCFEKMCQQTNIAVISNQSV